MPGPISNSTPGNSTGNLLHPGIACAFTANLSTSSISARLLTTEASYGSGPSDASANVASKESSLSDKEWLPGRKRNIAVLATRTHRQKLTVLQGGKPRYFQPEGKIDGGVEEVLKTLEECGEIPLYISPEVVLNSFLPPGQTTAYEELRGRASCRTRIRRC